MAAGEPHTDGPPVYDPERRRQRTLRGVSSQHAEPGVVAASTSPCNLVPARLWAGHDGGLGDDHPRRRDRTLRARDRHRGLFRWRLVLPAEPGTVHRAVSWLSRAGL